MAVWDFLKKGAEPVPVYDDSLLGPLMWNEDDEAWIGKYNGHVFALAYDKKQEPDNHLAGYARKVLTNSDWLNQALAEAKNDWLLANPKGAALFAEEIRGLTFGKFYFFKRKNLQSILADLEGGGAERSWRIEFEELNCLGLGYDT